MPVVTVLPDVLELRLTTAERALAFHRGDVTVRRANIRSATITEDPWIWVRGIRAPGTAIPLTLAAGTWKFHGGKDFLLIKRAALAVVVDLVDEEYARIVVTTKHAPELIAALQLSTPTSAIPVLAESVAEPSADGIGPERVAETPATETPTAEAPAAEAPAAEAPATEKPRKRTPRPSQQHASEEPSGATEPAE
ncbi:hypothetical protein HQQ80_08395 [Microbacteriaceae bacterium VKM Ac-2855]|nr:hypothetical protein [Microbacteriaceae bacterium VKM Ac-2855]